MEFEINFRTQIIEQLFQGVDEKAQATLDHMISKFEV